MVILFPTWQTVFQLSLKSQWIYLRGHCKLPPLLKNTASPFQHMRAPCAGLPQVGPALTITHHFCLSGGVSFCLSRLMPLLPSQGLASSAVPAGVFSWPLRYLVSLLSGLLLLPSEVVGILWALLWLMFPSQLTFFEYVVCIHCYLSRPSPPRHCSCCNLAFILLL